MGVDAGHARLPRRSGAAVARPAAEGGRASCSRTFPYDFLYGSIAADTSIAKKYAPVGPALSFVGGRASRSTTRRATTRCSAFALGYLAHLAADSVAHNYFVPKQLAVTSSTSALGHSYWESRFETHLGRACSRQRARPDPARPLARRRLLDRILSPTIFSTPDQPPDLPRHGVRGRQRVVAAHLPADDGEQPLGSPRRRRRRATWSARTTSSSTS